MDATLLDAGSKGVGAAKPRPNSQRSTSQALPPLKPPVLFPTLTRVAAIAVVPVLPHRATSSQPCPPRPQSPVTPASRGNMARLVSTSLLRGLTRSCSASSMAGVSRPTFQQFMTYSSAPSGDSNVNGGTSTTRVAADPDTHQDFQPTSKGSGMSLDDIVAKDIKDNPVLIYMKGYPDAPRCGFSALAVKVLQQYGVSISARDILTNIKLKESVKAHTNWPTFPQIFIKGEFVGGSDIILNMHQKGELKDLLNDINAQKGDQDSAP